MTRARISLALIAGAAAVSLAHALWISTVVDDGGIALAYARSFAAGEGMRLTPLSPRVEAFSDPLWVIWLACGYALGIGGPSFAHVSGALFGATAVLLTGIVPSLAADRLPQPVDAVAPWVLAFDTTYNFWTGAGLETGAFALALMAMVALIVAGSKWSCVPAGLLAVLRPEGALYALFAAAFRKERRAGSLASTLDSLRWLALAALPAIAWLLFRLAYYDQWLPNSFFAKRNWDYGGVAYLGAWFVHDPWHWALCVSPLAVVVPATRRSYIVASAGVAAAIVFILVAHGDWMAEHRFVAHVLPAAALAAGLAPIALQQRLPGRRHVASLLAIAIVAAAFTGAWVRSPERRRNPELPLTYVGAQGRWFRDEARSLGLLRPRIAHFDIGGLALESGGEVVDLSGLADLFIGRVGYQAHAAVRDYVFGDVRPDMVNVHGPCWYLRSDPRLPRDYVLVSSGSFGENWVRRSLVRREFDPRCPSGQPPSDLHARLESATPRDAAELWLCGRAYLQVLPDVRLVAHRFAVQGLRGGDGARERLEAAVTLDPTQVAAAQRLVRYQLQP